MYHIVNTHTFDNSYHCNKKQVVYEITNGEQEYCIICLPNDKFSLIDKKFMNDVMKYNWFLSKHGYVMHGKRVDEHEIKTCKIYLHFLIMKLHSGDPNFNIERHVTSIDHINRQPYDNRVSNLRVATNKEQNENKKMRSDRYKPLDELLKVGITEYPRHIRFDSSENGRFVIEYSHPQLQSSKKRYNGSRKGTIIEKYLSVLQNGYELDQEWLKNKSVIKYENFEQTQIREKNICIELIQSLNEHLGKDLVSIDELYESFATTSSYKTHIDFLLQHNELKDPNVIHEENGFVLTKRMLKKLPKHMFFKHPTKTRGCSFEYDFKNPETKVRKQVRLTTSKSVSLEKKYNDALMFENK
jgi:hypothetical protein